MADHNADTGPDWDGDTPSPSTAPDHTGNPDTGGDTNGDASGEPLLNDGDTGQPANAQEDKPLTRADLEDAAQRIADRQVNALLKELRGGKNRRRERDPDGDNRGDNDRARTTDDRYDIREARMAYREYLGDRHRFVDPSERELANTLGSSLIGTELAEHGDPDRAGRRAAEQVAGQLSAYRKAIETATINRLRTRGALITEPGRGGESPPPGSGPSQSTTADLRAAARSMAEEFNREQGHPTPTG